MLQYGWTLKTLCQVEQPVTKGQILYNSTYMRYLDKSNLWRQKTEWWLPGIEEEGENGKLFNEYAVSVWENDKRLEMDGGDDYPTM